VDCVDEVLRGQRKTAEAADGNLLTTDYTDDTDQKKKKKEGQSKLRGAFAVCLLFPKIFARREDFVLRVSVVSPAGGALLPPTAAVEPAAAVEAASTVEPEGTGSATGAGSVISFHSGPRVVICVIGRGGRLIGGARLRDARHALPPN
jgi:hypothetical protein